MFNTIFELEHTKLEELTNTQTDEQKSDIEKKYKILLAELERKLDRNIEDSLNEEQKVIQEQQEKEVIQKEKGNILPKEEIPEDIEDPEE